MPILSCAGLDCVCAHVSAGAFSSRGNGAIVGGPDAADNHQIERGQ